MPAIQFPEGCAHARQTQADGRCVIVNKNGTRFLDHLGSVDFGNYQDGQFIKFVKPEPVAVVVRTLAPMMVPAPAVPPAPVNHQGMTKTQFIESLVIAQNKTARQIAEATVAVYGGDLAKTLHYVCSTPFRLKKKGINARFLPARGGNA